VIIGNCLTFSNVFREGLNQVNKLIVTIFLIQNIRNSLITYDYLWVISVFNLVSGSSIYFC